MKSTAFGSPMFHYQATWKVVLNAGLEDKAGKIHGHQIAVASTEFTGSICSDDSNCIAIRKKGGLCPAKEGLVVGG